MSLEYTDGLQVSCHYRSGLFKAETIEYLMGEFEGLLDQVIESPALPVVSYKLFTQHQGEYPAALNAHYQTFGSDLSVPGVSDSVVLSFMRQAQRCPDSIAIKAVDGQLSYGLLLERSTAVVSSLQGAGVKPGEVVGLLVSDPIDRIVSILGVMQSGCISTPFSIEEPEKRFELLVSQVSPTAWIIDKSGESQLTNIASELSDTKVLSIDGCVDLSGYDWGYSIPLGADYECPSTVELAADTPSYIYFTSGSTGTPKPVLGRSESLSQFIQWEIETFGLDSSCRVSQLTSSTFDASLRDMFVGLCSGGQLCIPPQGDLVPDRLLDWLDRSGVSLVHCVPSLFRTFLGSGLSADKFKGLGHILLSGEVLHVADVRRWYAVFGDRVELVNLYGATETTLIKCYYRLSEQDLEREYIPVGKPIGGAGAIVLDEFGEVCSRGQVGELYIRSPYISHGYYGQEVQTSEIFVANPLSGDTSDLVYCSGDLALVLADGNLRLLGRKDHQVKVNGIRVDLSELEQALMLQPSVESSVVVAVPDEQGSVYLHAYVVGEAEVDTDELREGMLSHIPQSLLPRRITPLEEMPLTATGKVDRKWLMQQLVEEEEERTYVAPRSEVEVRLSQIWSEVLGVERVGIEDNFFELGGHSLKALLAISRIRKAFEVDLALKSFFESPTIAGLVEHIDVAAEVVFEPIAVLPVQPSYAVSAAHRR